MNKKGFIDFDDLNPIAVLLGVAGGILAFWISGFYDGGAFWRIASGLGGLVISFFMVQKMSE